MKMTIDQIDQAREDEGLRIGDFKVRVIRDEDSQGSREWDNITTMYCRHSRYNLGDIQIPQDYTNVLGEIIDIDSQESFIGWLKEVENEKVLAIRPLTLYDHSGLVMHIGTPTDRWDSMLVGWIVVTESQANAIGLTDRSEKALLEYMEDELKTYNQDLSGDVWGYTVEKATKCASCGHEEFEEIDSCWSFYDDESLLEAINNNLED